MIAIGENKSVICKGDFHPAELYKGDKKIAGYTITEFEGENSVVLENCYNDRVYDAKVHGKNLLDVNKHYGEWANDNGGVSIPNSGVLYHLTYSCKVVTDVFKENTQYTFSCKYNIAETTTTTLTAQMKYTDGTRSYVGFGLGYRMGEGTASFTSTAGKTVASFSFTYGTTSKIFNGELTEMQIEEGTTATEHESALADATMTVRGKNILDMSKLTVSKGYYVDSSGDANSSNTNFIKISPINVEPNTTYTISSNVFFYSIWFYNGSASVKSMAAYNMKKKQFTTPENCNYIGVSFDIRNMDTSQATGVDLFEWAMLEKGEGDGEYEPYIEPQTVNVENGEITADIPTFRGTTVIELDVTATISGSYKKVE